MTESAPEIIVNGTHKTSAFFSHLRSYPIVDATVSYTTSIPLVKKVSTTATPYVDRYVKPAVEKASPVLSKVDKFGDSTLSRIDKYVPALKTTAAPDIPGTVTKSVESVKSTTHIYTEAAKSKVNGKVVEPTKVAVGKAKQRTVALYDAKGRPFVRARLDPVFRPVNSRLVALVEAYLPPAKSSTEPGTTASAPATELGRFYLIGVDAVGRVKPMISDKLASTKVHGKETVDYVLAVPTAAKAHVIAVWEDKKAKTDVKSKPITGPIVVSLSTGRQLVMECFSYVESFAHARVDTAKSFGKKIANGSLSSKQVVDAVPDEITSEAVQE
ncbi:hypothetical protein V1512DRAFT_239140 [Lipomyces arxii]|uniref:uncharacterized protein n=1 Tax=Lipomyces arxii TaxID=56418 RepID=UPI0034CF6243